MVSPFPVSLERPGPIHSARTSQSQHILERNNSQLGNGTHGQPDQIPMNFTTVGTQIFQHFRTLFLDLRLGLCSFLTGFSRILPDRRNMIMGGRVHDGILRIIVRSVMVGFGIMAESHLKYPHAGKPTGLP